MNENEKIQKRIKDRLAALPRVKINCPLCGRHIATLTHFRQLICFDCWVRIGKPKFR